MTAFHEIRRQQFLTDSYTKEYEHWLRESISLWRQNLPEGDSEEEKTSGAASLVANDTFQLFSLRYTAGEPLDVLREELTGVVEAYERYQQAKATYEQIPDISPFYLPDLGDYERALQLLSLCILFHREDLVRRVAAMLDPGYKGEDTLYEDLMAFYETGRIELDEWYHDQPYTTLIDAMYAENKAEGSSKLTQYCEEWYPCFKHVPWHDGHLRMTATDGDYFGYWAFEAGAVAFLCELEDVAITHMVYPKDLVAYARKQRDEGETVSHPNSGRLRGLPSEVVPQTGWWHTPALKGAQGFRYFEQGQRFPATRTTGYGDVIWNYDPDQQKDPPQKS